MNFDPAQYRAIFCDEASEHVVALEAALLRLESNPGDAGAVDEAFRSAHTIKGGADAIGFPGLAKFTHGLEELLGRLRGCTTIPRPTLDLLLEGSDCLGRYVAACKADGTPPEELETLVSRLKAASAASASTASMTDPPIVIHQPRSTGEVRERVSYLVTVSPQPDALLCALDPIRLLRDLATLGRVTDSIQIGRLPPIQELDPEQCYFCWSLRLDTSESPESILEVFAFAREKIAVEVESVPPEDFQTMRLVGSESLMGIGSESIGGQRVRQVASAFATVSHDSPVTAPTPEPIPLVISLVERGLITAEQALDALNRRRLSRPMLGGMAVQLGYITSEQLFEILAGMEECQPFGMVAMRLGYLSEDNLAKLYMYQELSTPPITEILVLLGLMTPGVMSTEVQTFRAEASISPNAVSQFAEIPDPGLPPPPDTSLLDEYGPMIAEFCGEADEHLETADRFLMTIDGDPTHKEALNAVYRGFHTIKGVSSMLGLGIVQMLAHEAENLLNLAREGNILLKGKPLDLVFVSTDALKRQIRFIRKWSEDRVPMQEDPGLGILLADLRSTVGSANKNGSKSRAPSPAMPAPPPPAPVMEASPPPPPVAAKPVETKVAPVVETPTEAVAPTEAPPPSPPGLPSSESPAVKTDHAADAGARRGAPAAPTSAKETVRVDKDRLDKLINTIGELVIAQSMAQQEFDELNGGSGALSLALPELSKISRDLQELSLSLRMVPLQNTFQKMARLVRDLSRKLDKPVELELHGEETELDKTVVDQLGDPLMHMVRNAVDHGLEDTAERIALGKSPEGHVALRAYHQGGSVYIELSDDGKGMDREKLIRKAVEKGIIPEGQRLSDAEAYSLIFQPGFSTAKAVTDVSGRGVGMDVVRRNVEALQGSILINTKLGKGTTFTIRLPLTLAIMDGLMVGMGSDVYVLPLLSVIESFRPRPSDVHTVAARGDVVTVRGEVVPLLRLHRLLGRPGRVSDPCQALVVLVEDQGRKHALLVDELLGQMQAVVKSLDANYRRVDGLAGATILGDGRVAMILDIHGLTQLHNQASGGSDAGLAASPLDLLGDLE